MKFHAYYLKRVHSHFDQIVEYARDTIPPDTETLVGTGLSGALVVPRLAEALGMAWAIVRKPNDGTHSSYSVEGELSGRWVFVDDLISSGETLRRVVAEVARLSEVYLFDAEFTGAWLYEGMDPGFRTSAGTLLARYLEY